MKAQVWIIIRFTNTDIILHCENVIQQMKTYFKKKIEEKKNSIT